MSDSINIRAGAVFRVQLSLFYAVCGTYASSPPTPPSLPGKHSACSAAPTVSRSPGSTFKQSRIIRRQPRDSFFQPGTVRSHSFGLAQKPSAEASSVGFY